MLVVFRFKRSFIASSVVSQLYLLSRDVNIHQGSALLTSQSNCCCMNVSRVINNLLAKLIDFIYAVGAVDIGWSVFI